MRKLIVLFSALVLVCLSTTDLLAQVNSSATLRGTVLDKTQAVIPGAEVKITHKETGLVRTATTGNEGSYVFSLLPAGHYEVRISMKGFATAAFENVELTVGQTTSIDANMSPSSQMETVTVEATGAALVDTQKTDVSRPITPAEVQTLPLNGRDFVNLALLAPGARPVPSYDPTKARIGVFATNGSSGRNVNMTVNGIDNKDGTVGGPVMQLPLEAILEFNISTQRFSAANGRSEGAAVNVLTKSGTNDFHGAIYFFDREAAFNTLNYFEEAPRGSGQKADFSRQQFGGSIGGPVKKDKTFLFFALERARENTSLNVTGTAYSELSLLKDAGFAVQLAHSIPTPYFDWRYNGRVDHRINDKNTISASYSNQNNRGLNDQAVSTGDLSAGNFTTNQLIIANATVSSVLSPNIVNSFTSGYQYWHNLIDESPRYLQFAFPSASLGTRTAVPQESFQRKWQFKDDIAFNHGAHSFKTGFDYLWEPLLGGILEGTIAGQVTFFDDPDVILSNKTKYPQGFATPGAIQTITRGTSGNPYFYQPAKMFGLYFQDDWKVKRNLTLNLGLRWDKDYNLNAGSEQVNARAYQYLKAIGSSYAGGLPHDDNKDFSPRFGLAYDLKGNGKHVIRAGYGLYYGQPFINITLFMLQQANQFLYSTVSLSNSVVPGTTGGASDIVPTTGLPLSQFRYGIDPLPGTAPASTQLTGAATVGRIIDPKYRNPYTQQWNGGYTWALHEGSVIEVEYVHVLSLHESKSVYINPTINGVRFTTPLFQAAGINYSGPIQEYQPSGRSRYDGMNLSYRRRMAKRFSVNATYVLSRGLAYNGNAAAFGNTPTDFLNYYAAHDLGPTPADERHRFTLSGLVDLPWGLKFAPIMQWASGRPYNVTEGITDVYGYGTGVAQTHAIVLNSDPTNLLATKAYTTPQLQACLTANTCHQVPYDYLRGEAFFQLDTRLSRTFKLGEKPRLELIFQAFDLTNRANFGANYQGNIRSTTFMQPTNFITGSGVIVPKSFSGEFGARFSF
jgi:hypothetical protein